jgi:hypothetical protein
MIPLNADAMAAIHELFKRAEVINESDLNHYVFPASLGVTSEPLGAVSEKEET